MIDLPKSTIVNRFIPKGKFYSKTKINTKLQQLFTDEIEKIVWTHKISPQTLNISTGDYTELQVFEITLKGPDVNIQILKHIDSNIPYPILFILKKADVNKVVMSFKEPSSSKNNLMKVYTHYATDWSQEVDVKLKGRTVDEIYKNYLHQISPDLELKPEIDIKLTIEKNQLKEKISKQINALNRAILHEISIAKQQMLARERHALEQQL